MNRRDFTKILGLFAGGVALPSRKEEEMKLGDLLAEIAGGGRLKPSEIEQVRRQMNDTYSLARAVSNIVDGSGKLDPNIFGTSASNPFSLLPHESASIYTDTSPQTVGTGAFTDIKPYLATSNLTWSKGLAIDITNGRISISGIPKDAVILITGHVSISDGGSPPSDNGVGERFLKWKDNGTEEISVSVPAASVAPTSIALVHVRRVDDIVDYGYLQVYQNSTADRSVDALFTVTRLR